MYPLDLAQPYPFNQWWLGAHASEVTRDILPRTILGEPVVFYRKEDGAAVAMAGLCPHRHYPMHKGCLVGDAIRCGYHGFTFAADGRCVAIPSQPDVPAHFGIRAYPVVERGGSIWIWTGAVEAADPALVPDVEALGLGVAGWAMEQHPMVTLKGRYQLLIENLLDLSHVSFIHDQTIPGGGAVAMIPPEIVDTPASLNVLRLARGVPPNPMIAKLFPDHRGRVDQHFDAEYFGPNLIRTGGAIAAAREGADRAGHPLGTTNFIHAITPETPTSTHYFVVTARDFRLEDEGIARMNLAMGTAIQPEDLDAIESIERTVERFGDPRRELSCAADVGAIRVRRRLAAQIRAEQGSAQAAA